MTETSPQPEQTHATVEPATFVEVLKSFIGRAVTIVNPESYEDAPLGHEIRKGWYPAKPISVGEDYLVVITEYKHAGKKANKEPVKQYIPFRQIKRVSVMHTELLIHI